jgi:transcriptional regulator with XRE-family HTH domain
MSTEIIKKNITRILDERNWSLPELEKKAGTNRNIYEIIRGRNTKPSAHLIQQVARTLNVDYKEILEDHNEEVYIKNYSLLSEACILVIEELKSLSSNDIKISYHALGLLVQEVCSYAEQFDNKTIDPQFVKWSIMKYYSTDQK